MTLYIIITGLVILACFLQIMIVLVQNSKGGGLAANFTSAGQSMGVRKTADFLEKSTWTIAVSIFVLCLLATAAIPRGGEKKSSRIQNAIENAVNPDAVPVLPTATPPPANTQATPQTGKEQPKK